jgi:hypothetical protein
MPELVYQLSTSDSSVFVSADDLAALGLSLGEMIGERELRRRLSKTTNQSLTQTIHAMLDQEEPHTTIVVKAWPNNAEN